MLIRVRYYASFILQGHIPRRNLIGVSLFSNGTEAGRQRGSRMVLLDVGKDRVQYQPPFPQRVNDATNQRRKWHRAILDLVGTTFVLVGLGISLLTLRLVLVFMHGMLH